MSISLSLSTFFFWLTPATFTSPVALRVPRACRSLVTGLPRPLSQMPMASLFVFKFLSEMPDVNTVGVMPWPDMSFSEC